MSKEQDLIYQVIDELNDRPGWRITVVSHILNTCNWDRSYNTIKCIKEMYRYDKSLLEISFNMINNTSIKYFFKDEEFLIKLNKLMILK